MIRTALLALPLLAALTLPAAAAERGAGGSAGGGSPQAPTTAPDRTGPRDTLAGADAILARIQTDSDKEPFRKLVRNAKAIIVVPSLVKGGFIIGAEGGRGILLVRQGNGWSDPGFVGMGSASLGLQAGAQVSQLVLAVMTEKGLNGFLEPNFKIGADGGIAVAWLGAGMDAGKTFDGADVVAMSTAQGLFAGISLEGSVFDPDDAANAEIYGKGATLREIVNGQATSKAPRLKHLP